MSKIDFPKLAGDLTAATINGWLGRCEDTHEAWQAVNGDKSLATRTLITLAGLKMEENTAATWWNENREELKKLGSWEEFAQKVKARFVPGNWRMSALAAFYSIHQGTMSFLEFVKALQTARNALASAGTGFTIDESVYKNHLLFHAHPILRLRIIAQPTLPYATMRVDALISSMSSTWDSLIAEKVVRPPVALALPPLTIPPSNASSSSTSLPTPTSSTSFATPAFAPLTHTEKEALRAANGCYHCRKTPQSPGWVRHRSDNCPGDPARGIPPRTAPAVVAAVGPAGFSAVYEEGYAPVAAVFPTHYSDDEDDFSAGTDDSDLSTRDT